MWSVECGAFCCVCVCLCLCLSLYGREVAVGYARYGSNFLKIKRPFGRLLNFSSGIIGKRPFWAKSSPGGHGRLREVTGGYGGRNGGKWRNGSKKVGENQIK